MIQSTLGTDFTIDDYIGDPRDLTLDNYSDLLQATKTALADVTERYDIKDFVRLIKFFDNVVFKMIKDFVPARSTTDTGIIIKPHLLDRSKAKSISASATQPEYSGSIDTAFITGSNPGTYKSSASGSLRFDSESSKFRAKTLQGIPGESSTRHVGIYRKRINTPERINTFKQYKTYTDHGQEESKYDGELKNSQIVLSTGELNDENNLKQIKYPFIGFDVFLYKNPPVNICLLDSDSSESVIISIKEFTKDYIINIDPDIFPTVSPTTEYYEDLSFDENGDPINLNDAAEYGDQIVVSKDPNSTEFPQYTPFPIVAYDDSFDDCNLEKTFQIVRCKLKEISSAIPTNPSIAEEYDLTSWYSGLDTNYNYNILVNGEVIENTTSYRFSAGNNIVKIQDSIDPENCFIERSYNVNSCPITVQTPYIVNDFVSYYPVVDFFGKKGNLDIQYLIRFEKEDGSTYSSRFLNERITANTEVFNDDGYLKIPTGDENYLVSDRGDLLTLFFSGNEDDFQEFFQIKFKAFNTEECQPVTSATFLQLEARVPTAVVYKATAILDLNVCFACQYGKDPYSPTVDLYFIETEYLRPAENTYEVKNGNLDDAVGKQVWKTEEAARDKSTERTDQSSPGYYREGTDNPFLVSDGILEYFGSEGCADAQALCNIRISKWEKELLN